jgi:exoribonuclease II
MARSGHTRREEMRAIRSEDLRDRIRNSGCLVKIIDNIEKMQILADTVTQSEDELPISTRINNLQMTNNQWFKLLDKVLPTLKEVAVEGELKVFALEMTGVYDEPGED